MKKSFYLALGMIVYLFYIGGCNDSSVTDKGVSSVSISLTTTTLPGSIVPSGAPAPATITVAVNPASGLSALGTATISVTVKDGAGVNVVDGTPVSFTINSASLGSINPTSTTVAGVATATFTAANVAGTATVTVTAGAIIATKNITILGANVGSIQFSSATPNVIGVKGSGQQENAVVTFSVQDINGQPVSDGTAVTFTISGPQGGESLNPTSASTINGLAKTTIQSGTVAGPVRVTASTVVSTVTIASSSTGVSIGGGVPSMSHFTLARTLGNLAGLSYVDLQSTISAYLADRYGNFNVLTGTSISFYTEGGAIDRSGITNAVGSTSVVFRTQDPLPLVFSALNPQAPLTGDPANGLSTIIAVTRGEECFNDLNGNGVFDPGEYLPACDLGEPFIDANDNGVYDTGEFYIDANKNGVYDGPNSAWDGNILIWKKTQIGITGGPTQISITPGGSFAIANNGSQNFSLCVADSNANSIMGGSTVEVVPSSNGIITGGGPFTLPDIVGGPYCFGFNLADALPTDTDPPAPATLTITVTWKVPGHGDFVATRIISGTID